MASKTVNIKDVAHLAQVSTATVSRYLHGELNRMTPATAQKVAAAIDKLNYVPNAAARQLITNTSKTIAVIVVNAADSFSTSLFKGICSVLEPEGYIPALLDTDSSQAKEKKLINSVGLSTYDGLILQPLGSDVATIKEEVRRQMPIITLDRNLDYSPWPQIISNNFDISQKAARYFYQQGFQDIIVLTSPIAIASTRQQRLAGLKSVYQQINLIEIDENHYDHHHIITELRQILKNSSKKTLIFGIKERWLLEFLPELISLGLLKDNNIQISGFADTQLVPAIWPGAKMINQHPWQMGKQAGIQILQLINKKSDISPTTIIPANF